MAKIISHPKTDLGKHFGGPPGHAIFNSEATRHVMAVVLSLMIVGMMVAALLLSANEGSRADREAAWDREISQGR